MSLKMSTKFRSRITRKHCTSSLWINFNYCMNQTCFETCARSSPNINKRWTDGKKWSKSFFSCISGARLNSNKAIVSSNKFNKRRMLRNKPANVRPPPFHCLTTHPPFYNQIVLRSKTISILNSVWTLVNRNTFRRCWLSGSNWYTASTPPWSDMRARPWLICQVIDRPNKSSRRFSSVEVLRSLSPQTANCTHFCMVRNKSKVNCAFPYCYIYCRIEKTIQNASNLYDNCRILIFVRCNPIG